MKRVPKIEEDDLALHLVLGDELLSLLLFWGDALTEEMSIEQKLMPLDRSDHVLVCTGRKIAKCLTGDAVIFDPLTGERRTIRELCDRPEGSILTLDGWKITSTDRFTIWPNATVDVFEVKTKTGVKIEVSGNHPFLTGSGWVECDQLRVGDLVGIARRSLFPEEDTSGLTLAELAIVAYLIGDGCIKHIPVFTCADPRILSDFRDQLARIDPGITLRHYNQYDYAVVGNKPSRFREATNPIRVLLSRLGLWGKGSHDKFVPRDVFRCDRRATALFLSRLFATDGYVSGEYAIGYSSVSRRLIEDIQELLRRFGVLAGIYSKRISGGGVSYSIEICDSRSVDIFASEIGIYGKEARVEACRQAKASCGPSKHDRIPLELVRSIIIGEGISPYQAGVNAGLRFKSQYAPSRDKASRVAEANGLSELAELVEGDVYWDEIVSILPRGLKQTYDLTVEGTHNFVANGFITHNTIVVEHKIIFLGINHLAKGGSITEALACTPRDTQLAPIVDRVYGRVQRTPFLKEFVARMARGDSPTMEFRTGLMWYFRIEGVGGSDANMTGLRAKYILLDEGAFGNHVCHNSRVMTALPNCKWWYSGVPNGMRDSPFYMLDQTSAGEGWSRHNYSTYVNPIFQGEAQKQVLIDAYLGENTQGYLTQVLGKWGDEMISSFPPGAISTGVQPYFVRDLVKINPDGDAAIAVALGVPAVRAERFAIGLDYGFSPDPSVLILAYTRDDVNWECYLRLVMRQVAQPVQMRIALHIIEKMCLGAFGILCCDNVQIIQALQDKDPGRKDQYVQTVPGGTQPLQDEKTGEILTRTNPETGKPETIMVRVKQLLNDRLRQYMINRNLELPGIRLALGNDLEMVEELRDTTERKTPAGYTVYFSRPDPQRAGAQMDHNLDAGRYLADAISRTASFSGEDPDRALIAAMGWAGKPSDWPAPW